MANTNQYTPSLPWNRVGNHVVDVGSRTVCVTYSGKSDQREADAERIERADRIYRCVNAHDELVKALRALMGACGQASFCLRELLPDDSDAQLTVELLNGAMSKGRAALPPAPQES